MISESQLQKVIAKLKVKPGLIGESLRIEGPWRVGLFWDREEKAFLLYLYWNNQEKLLRLDKDIDIKTAGRSQWMADNTWRLTEKGRSKVESNVLIAIRATEAKLVRDK